MRIAKEIEDTFAAEALRDFDEKGLSEKKN